MKNLSLRALLSVAAIALSASFSTASAASYLRCPSGSFCLYEHRDFEGRRLPAYKNSGVLASRDWDTLSSAVNRTNSALCLYNAGNGDGRYYLVATVRPRTNLIYIGDKTNDMVDAWVLSANGSCELTL